MSQREGDSVAIIDFGLSRAIRSGPPYHACWQGKSLVQTCHYRAPEVWMRVADCAFVLLLWTACQYVTFTLSGRVGRNV